MWVLFFAGTAMAAFIYGEYAKYQDSKPALDMKPPPAGHPETKQRQTEDPQQKAKEAAADATAQSLGTKIDVRYKSGHKPSDDGVSENGRNQKLNTGSAPPSGGNSKEDAKKMVVWAGTWRWNTTLGNRGMVVATVPIPITRACRIGNKASRVAGNRTLLRGEKYPSTYGYWLEWDDAKCSEYRKQNA